MTLEKKKTINVQWEQIYNSDFKGVEFDTFKKQVGLNSFRLTPKKWVEKTPQCKKISTRADVN